MSALRLGKRDDEKCYRDEPENIRLELAKTQFDPVLQ
jgi:hypothetical protein